MARTLAVLVCLGALILGFGGCQRRPGEQVFGSEGDTVLLLHGLARSGCSMEPLARDLASAGYTAVVLDYPSTTAPIAELCAAHLAPALARCRARGAQRIHVVSHSMGGILLRYQVASVGIPELGHVVMLAPPNQGSEVVDTIGHWRLFGWINGPAGRELGTGPDSTPSRLPPVAFSCGVIAGDRSINWINSALIPGPDDGKVAVARTAVAGMADHLVLPLTHPLIMRHREVWSQIRHFLDHGGFDPERGPRDRTADG
jgi:triacylglycerol lipase